MLVSDSIQTGYAGMRSNSETEKLIGVVLAGGKSSRLGRDKAEVIYQGQTMLQRSVQLLQLFTDRVLIAGRTANQLAVPVPTIMDEAPGLGPIGGICTALRLYGGPLLVIPCDLPYLNQETLENLITARNACAFEQLMTTYQQIETNFIEALVAIYESEALNLLQKAISIGCYKLSSAIPHQLRCHIPYSVKESSVFFNLNRPQDLKELEESMNQYERRKQAHRSHR